MANTMLERVARAMWEKSASLTETPGRTWSNATTRERMTFMMYASAGVEALRNPTPDVIAAAGTADEAQWNDAIAAVLVKDGGDPSSLNFVATDRKQEEAYRRGFEHGAYAVFDANTDFFPPKRRTQLKTWVGLTVHKWRHNESRDEPILPPQVPEYR